MVIRCIQRLASASLALVLGVAGCSGEDSCHRTTKVTLGAPQAVGDGLIRTMGASIIAGSSCASATSQSALSQALHTNAAQLDGQPVRAFLKHAYVPVLPLFHESQSSMIDGLVLPPKIMQLDQDGAASDYYVFSDAYQSFGTGFYQLSVTIGDATGAVARGLQISTAADASGAVYASNSVSGEIFRIDAGGKRTVVKSGLPGVMNLALRSDGTLLAALPARFDNGSPSKLSAPPSIVSITPAGAQSTLYTFPSTGFDYSTGFSRGISSTEQLAVGFLMEMALSRSDDLYVALNTTGALFKISRAGMGTALYTGLPAPVGLAVDIDDTTYLTLAPLVDMNGGVTSGLTVAKLEAGGALTTLYQGEKKTAYNTGYFTALPGAPGKGFYPIDAVGHLALDGSGNLYLQDSLANQLLFLPRS